MTSRILFNIGSKPACTINAHVWDGEPAPDTRCRCGSRTWENRGENYMQYDSLPPSA